MINLLDLEKKINSELTTKIKKTEIKHNQIYVEIDKDDLIDVTLFIKTNNDTSIKSSILISINNWLCLILVFLILVFNSELIFFSKSVKSIILSN